MRLKEIIKVIHKESMTDISKQLQYPQSAGSRGLKHLRKKIAITGEKTTYNSKSDSYTIDKK